MFSKTRQFVKSKFSKAHSNKKEAKRKDSLQEDPAFFPGKGENFEAFFKILFFLAVSGFLIEFGDVKIQVPGENNIDFCQKEALNSNDRFFGGDR